jgi:cytochrome c553
MKIALSLALATLFFVGCGDNSTKKTEHEVKKEVTHKEVAQAPVETHKVVNEVKKVEKYQRTGKEIFATCASCHGQHAEKHALGKSKIIKGWSEAKIESALHGYKDGTYGGSMKGVMKGQASKLSDEDIKMVAKHISQL